MGQINSGTESHIVNCVHSNIAKLERGLNW